MGRIFSLFLFFVLLIACGQAEACRLSETHYNAAYFGHGTITSVASYQRKGMSHRMIGNTIITMDDETSKIFGKREYYIDKAFNWEKIRPSCLGGYDYPRDIDFNERRLGKSKYKIGDRISIVFGGDSSGVFVHYYRKYVDEKYDEILKISRNPIRIDSPALPEMPKAEAPKIDGKSEKEPSKSPSPEQATPPVTPEPKE